MSSKILNFFAYQNALYRYCNIRLESFSRNLHSVFKPLDEEDGYAADVSEGKISREAHISINAYYYRAVSVTNKLCRLAGLPVYRADEKMLYDAIIDMFYDREAHLFVDGEEHRHISLVGNAFPFAFA